jgi:2-keto-4-pentenoate hydratase/2-oxohepta-3-ene-1,7-dioic acid hydratase in catechol pathway
VHDRNQRLFDLAKAAERNGDRDPAFASMTSLIDAGDAALDRANRLFDRRSSEADLSLEVAKVQLLAPVPEPRQMRDGMSFPTHIVQAPRGHLWLKARLDGDQDELKRLEAEQLPDVPGIFRQQPLYYITNRFSVRGPDTTVIWPSYSQLMDDELEFGIFTKKKASNISKKRASEHIFGYTIFNDFSARDAQRKEMEGRLGPAKGKSFDGGNVIGPWIVTPDEIGDPYILNVQVRVNGETRSKEITQGMLFSFEGIIAHVSHDETLMPGEFIDSGTVGNCCGLERGWLLQDGDTVELEVEKICVLRNTVRRQPQS